MQLRIFLPILFTLVLLCLVQGEKTVVLPSECPIVFDEIKLKDNFTIAKNGTINKLKYGCASCFNTTTNLTYECEPCYQENKSYYKDLPLKEYVKLTQTDIEYKTDRILIGNELKSFKINKNNVSILFENSFEENSTIINFKNEDKVCIYDITKVKVTCSSINGYICNSDEVCPGLLRKTDDTNKCCEKQCENQTTIIKNETKKYVKELSLSSEAPKKESLLQRIFNKLINIFS